MFLRMSLVVIVLAAGSSLIGPGVAVAQDATRAPAKVVTPAIAEFQTAFAALKQVGADLQKIRVAFQTADVAGQKKLEQDYNKTFANGSALHKSLLPLAEKAFADSTQKDAEHTQFILGEVQGAMRGGELKKANRLLGLLLNNGFKDPQLRSAAAMTALAVEDYKAASEHLKHTADAEGNLSAGGQKIKDEIAARVADAKADDLPIIKMETSKGEIVIELFEKEAPNTVANFISLVEDKFYDGIVFHRVLDGFMAQGGDPTGTGGGGPGYMIPCECYVKNLRKHFAGTLSMAHAGKDTGGSQFFLTFGSTDHLDGKHTAFGRVIKGMEVLSKLNRIDPSRPTGVKPDKMTKVTVVRKRNHDYKPTKTPGR